MTSEAAASDLVRRLFGGNASAACHIPTQIHHFACHYGVPAWDPSDESFTFSMMPAAGGNRAGQRFMVQRGLLKERIYPNWPTHADCINGMAPDRLPC